MSTPVVPPSVAAVASDAPPKPVVPAEAIPQAPAAALDPLTQTEPSLLDKARDTILPIVEKVQTTAKPYVDAATAKAEQLADRLDGTAAPVAATPAGVQSRDVNAAASVSDGTAPSTTGTATEKAKGIFDQVSGAVTSTFHQITNTIETRTTTDTHPGLITQVTNVVHKGQERLDAFLDQPASATTGSHPVQTTTNSVPHAAGPTDPVVAIGGVVPVGVAAVPVVPKTVPAVGSATGPAPINL